MAVDPEITALLERVRAFLAQNPQAQLDLAAARAAATVDVLAGPAVEMAAVADHVVPGGDGQDMRLRVYRPTAAVEGGPVAVYLHGGGWAVGNADTHDKFGRALAEATGMVVVLVEYRLAPEHPFPAGLDDCDAAVAWVVAHESELGVDATRLAVIGESAGANLAAALTLRERERAAPRIRFQALLWPATDLDVTSRAGSRWPSFEANGTDYLLTAEMLLWYYDLYAPTERRSDPHISPWHAPDVAGLPPALVVTAELDPLRDEGDAYAERLAAAGVPVEAECYPSMIHGFGRMDGVLSRARDLQAHVGEAVRAGLSERQRDGYPGP